ncbi:MAG: hypothetical protein RBU21_20485 [FCB group bacterium]|jgi:hypothetical protein|nr:hypothetical protein [FCB group bacterium]
MRLAAGRFWAECEQLGHERALDIRRNALRFSALRGLVDGIAGSAVLTVTACQRFPLFRPFGPPSPEGRRERRVVLACGMGVLKRRHPVLPVKKRCFGP